MLDRCWINFILLIFHIDAKKFKEVFDKCKEKLASKTCDAESEKLANELESLKVKDTENPDTEKGNTQSESKQEDTENGETSGSSKETDSDKPVKETSEPLEKECKDAE